MRGLGAGLIGAGFLQIANIVTECLVCTRQGAKSFRGIISSHPPNNTFEVETLIILTAQAGTKVMLRSYMDYPRSHNSKWQSWDSGSQGHALNHYTVLSL